MDFTRLVAHFAETAATGSGAALAELFTEDGVYVDHFYGAFRGRDAIADMIETHFKGTSEDYRWEFFEPVGTEQMGYARYLFSYTSTLPEAKGKRVLFEGMSRFVLKDGKIRHYSEVFDRGLALSQLDFAAERIKKVVARHADELRARPEARPHLERD